MEKDYYFLLGISSDASLDAIKKAYRINAVKYHPDKHFGEPEFAQKFVEIKEAYDNLIDPDKRRDFDLKYRQFFKNKSAEGAKSFQAKQEKKEEKSQSFKYDPFVQVFSSYDREQQETPLNPPRQTPWGKPIPDNTVFFIYPKKIGKLIGGASNIIKDKKRETKSSYQTKIIRKVFKNIFIISVLFACNYLYLNYIHKEKAIESAILLWSIILIIRTLFSLFWYRINIKNIYSYNFNYFIGINGFAYYNYQDSAASINEKVEINFNEVTDLFHINKTNEFLWLNRFSKKVMHYANMENSNVDDLSKIEMNQFAEKYFTIYLLDNMEKELEHKGYIEFIVAANIPYIRLGIGFITFLKDKESFTYYFDDIKRIYTQEMQLYIEHKNYQKILFFKSGNQNSIPLEFLCNRQFFYKAMEILLGYRIN